jgi:hypothetical protein
MVATAPATKEQVIVPHSLEDEPDAIRLGIAPATGRGARKVACDGEPQGSRTADFRTGEAGDDQAVTLRSRHPPSRSR